MLDFIKCSTCPANTPCGYPFQCGLLNRPFTEAEKQAVAEYETEE